MARIDPDREVARMAAVYAGMSDEELQEAGSQPGALTNWAFHALREEMKRRSLDWPGKDMPLPPELPQQEQIDDPGNRPVVLRRYRDMPAAFVEKSVLDAAGIDCFLQDDNVVRMDWLWSNALGGIKLMVRENDATEAERILSQRPPVEENGPDPQGT
jgi:Putative prokaryotic signal transducing protein